MTQIGEIAGIWLGLCRKPPAVHALNAGFALPPEPACEGQPLGDSGRAGAIQRGIGAALLGVRTLNRNRQLLWFTLLAGLVLAGNAIGQAAFFYCTYNLQLHPNRIAWQFTLEIATLFCLVFLLAGLVLSVASRREGHTSFFEGLSYAKKYGKTLLGWSLVLALTGMLIIIFLSTLPARFPTPELLFLSHTSIGHLDSFLFATLSQFPFNLTGLPPADIFTEIPGYGGRSLLVWIYPGLRDALTFGAVNLFLFILTPFVVPSIVLGKKTLRGAVAGSFAMVKNSLSEVATCAVFLGVIAAAIFSTYLLIQAAHGVVTPLAMYYRPTFAWLVFGLLYDLALFTVAFVMATIGGIAVLEIYSGATMHQASGPAVHDTTP